MKKIKFEQLNNTRDLGGIVVQDGYMIVPDRLIRSGRLGIGSESDIERIGELVSVVVDFRSDNERSETPDPDIPGVENIHIPIIDDLVSLREEGTDSSWICCWMTEIRQCCGIVLQARTGQDSRLRSFWRYSVLAETRSLRTISGLMI